MINCSSEKSKFTTQNLFKLLREDWGKEQNSPYTGKQTRNKHGIFLSLE